MILSTIVAVASLLAVAAAAPRVATPPPSALRVPAPAGFNVTAMNIIGTGCPPDSVSYVYKAAGNGAIAINLSEYYVQIGPDILVRENARNCRIGLDVTIPSGFTFAVESIDYRGYYQLDTNITVTQDAILYFNGQILQSSIRGITTGPLNGREWTIRDYDSFMEHWSPCGETSTTLNVQSSIRLSNTRNTAGKGLVGTDTIDRGLGMTLNLLFQKCS